MHDAALHEPEGRARQSPARRLCIAKLRRARSDAPYRFKAPMHDKTDVGLSMNRGTPSPHPSPPVGERVSEGRVRGIRNGSWSPMHFKKKWGLSMNLGWVWSSAFRRVRRHEPAEAGTPNRHGRDLAGRPIGQKHLRQDAGGTLRCCRTCSRSRCAVGVT